MGIVLRQRDIKRISKYMEKGMTIDDNNDQIFKCKYTGCEKQYFD